MPPRHLFAPLALLGFAAAGAAPAAPAPDVLAALPGRVEAALVVPDLRALDSAYERRLEPLRGLHGGKELVEAAFSTAPDAAFSLGDEWDRLLALAGPQGEPVPAALVVLSRGEALGVQALLKVVPGFSERLVASAAGDRPPPYQVRTVEGGLELTVGDLVLHGRIDDAGWLRVAPDLEMLTTPTPDTHGLDPALAERVRGADGALFIQGGGPLLQMAASALFEDSPQAAQAVTGLRSLCLTWRSDGDRSYEAQLAVDLPLLAVLGPGLRKPSLANVLAQRWGDQATGFFSISVPEQARAMVVPLLDGALADGPLALSGGLRTALSRLEGRVGVVSFGSPDDWALGVEMLDPEAAAAAVTAVHDWLSTLAAREAPAAADAMVLEGSPEGKQVLHVRPDEVLQGARVAAVGSTLVVVRQRQRLAALTAAALRPDAGLLAGPLTPPVRATLERPSIALAYWVLGTDPGMFDWLTWLSKGAEVGLAAALPPGSEELAMARTVAYRLAPTMALAGYSALLTYDAAFAVDIEGSVLTLDLTGSDL